MSSLPTHLLVYPQSLSPFSYKRCVCFLCEASYSLVPEAHVLFKDLSSGNILLLLTISILLCWLDHFQLHSNTVDMTHLKTILSWPSFLPSIHSFNFSCTSSYIFWFLLTAKLFWKDLFMLIVTISLFLILSSFGLLILAQLWNCSFSGPQMTSIQPNSPNSMVSYLTHVIWTFFHSWNLYFINPCFHCSMLPWFSIYLQHLICSSSAQPFNVCPPLFALFRWPRPAPVALSTICILMISKIIPSVLTAPLTFWLPYLPTSLLEFLISILNSVSQNEFLNSSLEP